MKFLKQKESVVSSLTFIALMAAINVLISLIIRLVPGFLVLLIIVLPLTSTLVLLYTKNRYFLIYFFTTISLSVVINLSEIETTIFYIIPSILTGSLMGIFVKAKLPKSYVIILSSIIYLIFTYISILIFNAIADTNLVDFILNLIGLENFKYPDIIVCSFVFIISLIQSFLSYIVIKNECSKIYPDFETKRISKFVASLFALALVIVAIPFSFIFLPVCFIISFSALYFFVFEIYEVILSKSKGHIIPFVISLILSIFGSIFVFTILKEPYRFLAINIIFIAPSISTLISSFLKKDYLTSKINIEEK